MIQPPSPDLLRELARELGINFSNAELALYRNLMAGSLAVVPALETAPSGLPDRPRRLLDPSPAPGQLARCLARR